MRVLLEIYRPAGTDPSDRACIGVTTAQANPIAVDVSRGPEAEASDGRAGVSPLEHTFEEDFRAIATYVFRRTGDAELAREIACETYVHAVGSLGRWRDIGLPLRCWLLGIATRRLARHRRSELRRLRGLMRLWARGVGPEAAEIAEGEAVRRAIARLPLAQQDVLVLHHVEGLSVEQVGGVLEIPVGTVKSRLGRGRGALARAIVGECGSGCNHQGARR